MSPRLSAALAIITLVSAAAPDARAQGVSRLSGTIGYEVLGTHPGTGTAKSADVRWTAFSLAQVPSIDLTAGWMSGSAEYSPLNCQIARQMYCFGGSEHVRSFDAGVRFEAVPMLEAFGVEVAPVGSVGAHWTRTHITETEGPATLCIINDELVSCPDNPPFADVTETRRSVLPSYSYGVAFSRRVGKVGVRLEMVGQQVGFRRSNQHERLRFAFGLGL